jgi:uncharacterized protein (TIGR02145 family)
MKILLTCMFIIVVFLLSCKKDIIPVLETAEITNITSTSAISGGTINDEGSGAVLACGLCWNTSGSPTIENNKSTDNPGSGSFTSNITGLEPATKYYVRSYATNDAGTGYGKESTFTTLGQAPVASSAEATEISSSGAKLNGTVNANYLSTQVIFEYGPTNSYGITLSADPGNVNGNSVTSIFGIVTGLAPASVYHFRIKATNSLGTTYSGDLSFTTLSSVPVITTSEIINNTGTTVATGGNISYQGNSSVSLRGVCWSTTHSPTIQSNKTEDGTGMGTFTSLVAGLIPGTSYFIRAYASNNEGTGYGNELSFTTNAVPASLTTTAASGISATSATVGGNISNNGGAAISESGVCWSKSHNPVTTDNKIINSSAASSFSIVISGLRGSTEYYARAYAVNSAGTSYGNEISFTTTSPAFADLNTIIPSTMTTNSVVVTGVITSDGGADVTTRGICWGTSTYPTTAGDKTSEGTGTGTFTSSITGLTPDTKYYARAYTVTSWGTTYGNQVSFVTYAGTLSDLDGNTYYTLKMGTQLWMAENLKSTKFSNGDQIPTTTPATLSIVSEATPKYQWAPSGNENNISLYGRLYTGHAVLDSRNVCPSGWHVPTANEWDTFTAYLSANGFGFGGVSANIAKSIASSSAWLTTTSSWSTGYVGNDLSLNNSSGFNGLPAGIRNANGEFCCLGGTASWWSCTVYSSDPAQLIHYFILHVSPTITKHATTKHEASSVRCIKD